MRLRENLKHLVNELDTTVAALARRSGVPKQTLTDWSNGSIPKDVRSLKKLADALKVTIDSLCFHDLSVKKESNTTMDGSIEGLFEVRLRKIKNL